MKNTTKVSTLVALGKALNEGTISRQEYEYLYSLMAGIAAPTSFLIYDHFIVQNRLGRKYNTLSRGENIGVLETFVESSTRCR